MGLWDENLQSYYEVWKKLKDIALKKEIALFALLVFSSDIAAFWK